MIKPASGCCLCACINGVRVFSSFVTPVNLAPHRGLVNTCSQSSICRNSEYCATKIIREPRAYLLFSWRTHCSRSLRLAHSIRRATGCTCVRARTRSLAREAGAVCCCGGGRLVSIFALFLLSRDCAGTRLDRAGLRSLARICTRTSGHATFFVSRVRLRRRSVLFNARLGECTTCSDARDTAGLVGAG